MKQLLGAPPVNSNDAVHKAYVDTLVSSGKQMLVPRVPDFTKLKKVMSSPPTFVLSAANAASAISGSKDFLAISPIAANHQAINHGNFTWLAEKVYTLGTTYPNYLIANPIYNTDPYVGSGGFSAVEFLSDADVIEFQVKGMTSKYTCLVNDEIVSLTPITTPNDGNFYRMTLTFGSSAMRLIRLEATSMYLYGVTQHPKYQIQAAPYPAKGPKVFFHGDSFTELATGSGSTRPWWLSMSLALGWKKILCTAQGGTGYSTTGPGGRGTFRGRLAADVIPYAPDIVFICGCFNDYSASAATVQSEVEASINQIKAALPSCLIFITGPFANTGVEAMDPQWWALHDALKNAAAKKGVYHLDFTRQPLDGALPVWSGQLGATISAGATSATTATIPPYSSTVTFGGGEARVITSVSGSPGNYTFGWSGGLTNGYASGTAVYEVGSSLWTGTGKVGTVANNGNCDRYVHTDGIHPTQEANDAMAALGMRLVCRALSVDSYQVNTPQFDGGNPAAVYQGISALDGGTP